MHTYVCMYVRTYVRMHIVRKYESWTICCMYVCMYVIYITAESTWECVLVVMESSFVKAAASSMLLLGQVYTLTKTFKPTGSSCLMLTRQDLNTKQLLPLDRLILTASNEATYIHTLHYIHDYRPAIGIYTYIESLRLRIESPQIDPKWLSFHCFSVPLVPRARVPPIREVFVWMLRSSEGENAQSRPARTARLAMRRNPLSVCIHTYMHMFPVNTIITSILIQQLLNTHTLCSSWW